MNEVGSIISEIVYQLKVMPPIDADLITRANDFRMGEQLQEVVYQRYVAAVMDKLGDVLITRAKELRKGCEDSIMAALTILDEKAVKLPGVCTFSITPHTSTSLDREKLIQSLVSAGVDLNVIKEALTTAERKSTKDIVKVRWKKTEKEKG